jgi:hypothetical protein
MISDKAAESLRYVTIQKERHDSHDIDALKHELRGKKVWRVGGVGMWAYERDDDWEEQKKQVWMKWGQEGEGKDAWLRAARARTDDYKKGTCSRSLTEDPVRVGAYPRIVWRQAVAHVEAGRTRR